MSTRGWYAVAVAVLWIGTGATAFAQATDVCSKLDGALAPPNAIANFSRQPALFNATLNGTWAAGGDSATLTFADQQIAQLKDSSQICIRGFTSQPGDNSVRIEKAFLQTADGQPQNFQVVFFVPPLTANWLYRTVAYTFVGAVLAATAPAGAAPTYFSYSTRLVIVSKTATGLAAILFVLIFYVILARVTYDKEDAKDLKHGPWLMYVLSPVRIAAGMFGDASLSQVQVILFTLIVAGLLFQLWLRTGVLSDISTALLTLLGISAVGAGGARFTETIKTGLSDSTAQYLISKGWYLWKLEPLREHATFAKLLLTDGRLDVYKFQMAIFTVVVAAYVISAGQSDLSNVNISETMLYLMGISQGVYVGGKAVTDRTTDLESAVAEMMALDSQIQALNKQIASAPANADLKAQKAQRLDDYSKAAHTAVEEFVPLTHRKYPWLRDAKGDPVLVDGKKQIDPDVLKPAS